MNPSHEMHLYQNKMNEQHQNVMSALGALEGKYNKVNNKVNCVTCNKTEQRSLGTNSSGLDKGPIDYSYSPNRTNTSPNNDQFDRHSKYTEMEHVKEMKALKTLVQTQLSNIFVIFEEFQQKFEVNDKAHENVLLLEEKIKELEQVVFAICRGQD